MMRQVAIGIAGTAKNTGKTTTLSSLMDALNTDSSLRIALTSIGYDGESFDNVTGLPKPRITVREGMYAAVAERCMMFSRAQLEVLEDTGIHTPMGNILIGRVVRSGKLIISGPNKRKDLRAVLECLETHGVRLTIIDGALGRILPFVETDGIIVATGASRFTDLNRLSADTRAILHILGRPVLNELGKVADLGSLLTDRAYSEFLLKANDARTVRFSGIVIQKYFAAMANEPGLAGKRLLFTDPLKLLISGMPQETDETLSVLDQMSVEVGVGRSLRILGMTINPYYPRYRVNRQDYEPAYVDRDALFDALSQCSDVPCFDILRQGASALAGSVLSLLEDRAEHLRTTGSCPSIC